MWWSKRGRGRFAVGAGDADHLVRRQRRAGEREQFDIADDRHIGIARLVGNRVGIERHAGRQYESVKTGKIDFHRIGKGDVARDLRPCFFRAVPGGHIRPARDKAAHSSKARPCEAEHCIAFAAKGVG
jgi:hypothetical protein